MRVELVSPERILYSGESTMVTCRTLGGGDIAFMPGHAPFLGALTEGVVRIMLPGGGQEVAAVHGGFVQVANNKVSILSDVAELAATIDVARAERAREAAEAHLRMDQHEHDAECEAQLRRAHARIAAAGGLPAHAPQGGHGH
jgi:F-type H+-transporting ATPase subunit epsilon